MERFFFLVAAALLLIIPKHHIFCAAFSGPKKGFGATKAKKKQQKQQLVNNSNAKATAEQTARSLFGVCSHLQNPDLYSSPWANVCRAVNDNEEGDGTAAASLIATENIARGDIVSFYPIHSLGLRGNNVKNKSTPKRKKGGKQQQRNQQKSSTSISTTDYLVYDAERDGGFFGSNRRTTTTRNCIDFPAMTDRPELSGRSLFLDANPDREPVPGWLGHLCGNNNNANANNANCAAIPIEGAVPLCMVVATRDISEGERLVRDVATNEKETLLKERTTQSGKMALEKYAPQLAELKGFTDMAYAASTSNTNTQPQPAATNDNDAPSSSSQTPESVTATTTTETTDSESEEVTTATPPIIPTYKTINLDYPGLQEFNNDPDVYAVDDFLTADECNRIVAKCQPHMSPCVVTTTSNDNDNGDDAASTGESAAVVFGPDESRTSTESMLPRAEAPSVVSKLTSLLDCRPEQLEILQILRYEKGQEFKPHTDGFDGPVTASGFERSGRLVTIFCYLNDVKKGGHTEFPELNFSVAPKRGSAVVHFPATETTLREDLRTVHSGMPAIDEKWLLATWVWKHDRTDERYSESRLPKLSGDVI